MTAFRHFRALLPNVGGPLARRSTDRLRSPLNSISFTAPEPALIAPC